MTPITKSQSGTIAAIGGALLILFSASSQAASVNVGTHVLFPNTALQLVTVYVAGGDQVAGEDFYAQVGDGGAFNGGTDTKPSISFATIASGTIFSGNTNGDFADPGNGATHPLIWVDGTTTNSGTVGATGTLATLLLDTTGLWSGTFALNLTNVASSHGSFNTTLRNASAGIVPLSITNGSLIIGTPIAGDFDRNGVVDISDYITWRNGLGTTFTQADYDSWRSHYGQSLMLGAGVGVGTAVPEPTALLLFIAGLATLIGTVRRCAA